MLQTLIAKTKRKRRNASNGKRRGNVAKNGLLKSVKRLATYANSTVASQILDLKRMKRTSRPNNDNEPCPRGCNITKNLREDLVFL